MTKITHIGGSGIELIKKYEGFRSKPYICPAGVPTIGFGSTYYPDGKKVTLNDIPINELQGLEILKNVLSFYEKSVDTFVRDDINQNQFDALVDFAYNCGIGNLKTSTLLKKVNINPLDPSIRNEFMKWVYGGDGSHNGIDDDGDGLVDEKGERKKLPGLVIRRNAEANLYFME